MGAILPADKRLQLLLGSSDEDLAKIDAILLKNKTKIEDADIDMRTCTQPEAARRLGMSVSTIHRMMKNGVLKSVIVNKNPRILLSSVFEVGLTKENAPRTMKFAPDSRHPKNS